MFGEIGILKLFLLFKIKLRYGNVFFIKELS